MNLKLANLLMRQKNREHLIDKAAEVVDAFPYCSAASLQAYIYAYGIIEGKRQERSKRTVGGDRV